MYLLLIIINEKKKTKIGLVRFLLIILFNNLLHNLYVTELEVNVLCYLMRTC